VEEQVFFLAFYGNKAKTFVNLFLITPVIDFLDLD